MASIAFRLPPSFLLSPFHHRHRSSSFPSDLRRLPSSFVFPPSIFRLSRLPAISSFFKMASSPKLPDIVEAGDPVLHEPASPVSVEEIGSPRVQRIIDDMIAIMRSAPGVGLAAPQIGIPLQIIVLEDTKEYISYVSKEEADFQQRSPFKLLVICNPKLTRKGSKSARFFEGCLSIQGYRGLVERHLEVEVTGYGRDGLPIKFVASGWQARILQHECDHLEGLLYVDKMVSRTFRTTNNLKLVLPTGCPKLGVYDNETN